MTEVAGTHGQLTPENGRPNKAAKNNVKNFHGSLTTVVRAQNDTRKTANITDTIFNKQKVILLLQQSTFRRFAAKYLLKLVSVIFAVL